MKEQITNLLNDYSSTIENFSNNLSNIIFENQEGQEQHFDKISKSEQIAIYSIHIALKILLDAIYSYKSWFK